jgi:hypothetical protein
MDERVPELYWSPDFAYSDSEHSVRSSAEELAENAGAEDAFAVLTLWEHFDRNLRRRTVTFCISGPVRTRVWFTAF